MSLISSFWEVSSILNVYLWLFSTINEPNGVLMSDLHCNLWSWREDQHVQLKNGLFRKCLVYRIGSDFLDSLSVHWLDYHSLAHYLPNCLILAYYMMTRKKQWCIARWHWLHGMDTDSAVNRHKSSMLLHNGIRQYIAIALPKQINSRLLGLIDKQLG